jgi:hypothetical protein
LKDYLAARTEAGTPRGEEYARRLSAMPLAEAADEIADMFALCADEDLAVDIARDLRLDRATAEPIAAEMRKLRWKRRDERLDAVYCSLSAADLALLISRRLDGDAEDRRELAEALAGTGLGESVRLAYLSELVRFAEEEVRIAAEIRRGRSWTC